MKKALPVMAANAPLSILAHARLAAASVPPQRYGLSVVLRKAYPSLAYRSEGVRQETGFTVSGAERETVTWDDLPTKIGQLVRQRVTDDSLVAFHVLQSNNVHRVRVDGTRTIEIAAMP